MDGQTRMAIKTLFKFPPPRDCVLSMDNNFGGTFWIVLESNCWGVKGKHQNHRSAMFRIHRKTSLGVKLKIFLVEVALG